MKENITKMYFNNFIYLQMNGTREENLCIWLHVWSLWERISLNLSNYVEVKAKKQKVSLP